MGILPTEPVQVGGNGIKEQENILFSTLASLLKNKGFSFEDLDNSKFFIEKIKDNLQ